MSSEMMAEEATEPNSMGLPKTEVMFQSDAKKGTAWLCV
jgi:hypothetical protein